MIKQKKIFVFDSICLYTVQSSFAENEYKLQIICLIDINYILDNQSMTPSTTLFTKSDNYQVRWLPTHMDTISHLYHVDDIYSLVKQMSSEETSCLNVNEKDLWQSRQASYFSGDQQFKLRHIRSSKNMGRFRQEITRNRRNMEPVFPPEIFLILSDDLRPIPAGKHRKLTGIHRQNKNSTNFCSEYCFHLRLFLLISYRIRRLFRSFPTGSCGVRMAVICDLRYDINVQQKN